MTSQTQQQRACARRQPSQSRSQVKLELIFEAATRILDAQGLEGLTTNRIAEVAGVSIGTVYQYFSNKQGILAALSQREVNITLAKIETTLQGQNPDNPADRLRLTVRTILGAFGGRHRVRKLLIEHALATHDRQTTDAPAQKVVALLASRTLPSVLGHPVTLDPMQAFVLAQAVTGAIRAAIAHDETWLSDPAFENALVYLIRGFLGAVALS